MKQLVAIALLGACVPTGQPTGKTVVVNDYQTASAPAINCTPEQIAVSDVYTANANETAWTATCFDRIYRCNAINGVTSCQPQEPAGGVGGP